MGKKKKYEKLLIAALFLGGFVMPVKAAPAALTAGSAVVYEQMSEASAPLQNLIQDETPEQNEAEENAEGDGEEEAEETALPQIIENNRTKTYAVDALEKKIKDRTDAAEENVAEDQRAQNEGKKNHGTDWPFRLCIIVTLFSVAGALTFYKKLRKESGKQYGKTRKTGNNDG